MEFFIRLRGESDGIVDLSNNNTITNHNVTIVEDSDFANGYAMYFSGSYLEILMPQGLTFSTDDDFTMSFFYKYPSGSYPRYMGGFCDSDRFPSIVINQESGETNPYVNITDSVNIYDPSISYAIGVVHHLALVKNGYTYTFYVDGMSVGSVEYSSPLVFSNTCLFGSGNLALLIGYANDICFVDEALWTSDFTPPTQYLSSTKITYLSSNSLYKEYKGSLSLITNDWSGSTASEKENYVEQGNDTILSPQVLESIVPYKLIINESSNVKLTGVPDTQILTPTSLINTANLDSLTDITINGTVTNGSVKIAITTDLTTYKKYDPVQEDWVTCTDDDGMDISEVNVLTAEILSDIDISEGIAFKIIFVSNNVDVNIELTGISTVGDIDGSWSQSVHGTDYDVAYPNKTTMAVTLKTNGDYIINYPISSNS